MSRRKKPEKDLVQELLADAVESAENMPDAVVGRLLKLNSRNRKKTLGEIRDLLKNFIATIDYLEDALQSRDSSLSNSRKSTTNKDAIRAVEYSEFLHIMDDVDAFLGPGSGMNIPLEFTLSAIGCDFPLFPVQGSPE